MDNAAPPRSNQPQLPHVDEYDAAISLLLLSESGGGFCSTTADPTRAPRSAASAPSGLIIKIKTQKRASPDTPTPIYPCLKCNMIFQNAQVLGGHMTGHRAEKGKAAVGDHHNSEAASPSARAHECSLCHETFGTGQALGGHMRKHSDKSKLARKADSGSSASGSEESSASTSGARRLDQ